ncbi:hypothetical protein ATY30_26195 [Sinorhizobium americanum]|uniref:Phage integrase family protein n=2 Tax=Sinorhizobium TaxID=28105 RepID=A0A2S3YTE3_9HYPH|nr:hypothetical protein NXT3_PC01474 [Sinorhizobium fredii]PDT37484.1 hypothetical protein CO656_24055 [Sinorhizobium sp. FG01]PDT51391.1 hypothetical protein CO664_21805 [Sinorhizobium sp. NG07B]POH26041.1 hypothetical protein ATY30_26195 [Sinorhizobium americanum]POH34899.1 hypothetical protein ATY31_04905 [Sinorhizobium americanum]
MSFFTEIWACALPHLSTRQYSRVVESWVLSIGLDPKRYGTHSMRRTKAAHMAISEQVEL